MKNTGRILKARSEEYTHVPNSTLQDITLSWKAKGLLCYLLSLPANWVIYLEEVAKHSDDGYASTRTAFKELQEAGYIMSKRTKNGNLNVGWDHLVYPTSQNPERAQSAVGALFVDTAPADTAIAATGSSSYKNNIVQTKEDTKETLWPTFDDFKLKYEKNVGMTQAERVWKKLNQEDKEKVMVHLQDYVPATPDKKFRKDADKYLKNKCYLDEVINNAAKRIFDQATGKNGHDLNATLDRLSTYTD
jgi:hypothetical protein